MSFVETIRADFGRLAHRPPTLLSFFRAYVSERGFRAVVLYRVSNWLLCRGVSFLPSMITGHSISKTGAEIAAVAQIGPGLLIKHPVGIVIGGGARIGENCTILQGVTIGERYSPRSGHEYPIIGDRVTLCAKSSVLGGVSVGSDAVVGAHSLVLSDVLPQTTVVGAPARSMASRADAAFVR